jgi:hypothetical protein
MRKVEKKKYLIEEEKKGILDFLIKKSCPFPQLN